MACVSERAGKGSCTRHDSCSNNRRNDDWTWPKQAGRLMMRGNSKLWRGALIVCVAVSLLFSSGCAVFLVGARRGKRGRETPDEKDGFHSHCVALDTLGRMRDLPGDGGGYREPRSGNQEDCS